MTAAHLWIAIAALTAAVLLLASVRRLWAFLFVFIILFPKVPLAVVPGNTTPLRVDDVVIGVIIAGWLLARLFRPRVSTPPASGLTLPLVMYLAVALAATLIGIGRESTDASAGAFHFARLVEYALLYYLFFDIIRTDELATVVRVMAVTWLIVASVWLVQHWTFEGPLNGPLGNWGSYAPMFGATYDFGGYVMMTTLVLYAAFAYGGMRTPLVGVALAAGLLVALNGDSRASLLGLAAGVLLDVFLRLRLKVALAVVGLAAAAPFLLYASKMERLLTVLGTADPRLISREFLSDPSISVRLRNWETALDRWVQSPLVGDGLGAYLKYVRIYDLPGTPDGWYVRVLAETGLLGLLAFAVLFGALAWMLLLAARREPHPLPYAITYGAVLVVAGACVNAFFIDTFVSFKMMGIFWMIMAVATRIEAEGRRHPLAAAQPGMPLLAPAKGHA